MASKKKKKDKFTIDLGAQELIKNDKNATLTRKVDGAVFRFAFYGEDRHLEKQHKSVLDNYYARDLLDPHNKEHNSKRYWAGQGFEKIFDKAGIQQRVTASLKENLGNTTREEFAVNNLAALDEFRFINKELGKHSNIIWKVIVNNNPATKERMDELRDALDKLILYFDIS